jgi:hypothetical protein
MNGVLTFLSLVTCVLIVFVVPAMFGPNTTEYGTATVTVFDSSKAILICGGFAVLAGWFSYRQINGSFLLKIFMAALLFRLILGTLIFVFNGQEFFGGDALTYDYIGFAQLKAWGGDQYAQTRVNVFVGAEGASAWGMVYFVAVVYGLIGRNMLAIQFINSVLGAVTAPIIFLCAQHAFTNIRVGRFAALAVAFYPSLVLWSSQGLKDGPVVFFLALSILATLKLGEKMSFKYLAVLVCSLIAILSLRFYVFYMITVAIVGAFVIGMREVTAKSFLRQFAVVIIVGLALTYFGVNRYASVQVESFGNLQRIQRSRLDQSTSAQSSFGQDSDVSSVGGALSTIPEGMMNLLLAPFPWQIVSLRQSITLPEMVIWWTSIPLLVLGLWFSIRYRLRMISPMLIFTVMLTLSYSVFQGNVGTAYRQRAQLLVFYFIFVAVGLVLILEKRAERKQQGIRQRELAGQQTGPLYPTRS